jgi:hypothetical protein
MRVAILFAACSMSGGIAPASAFAADVVIYRCTDSFGALTVQNDTPCPKGSKQQKQVIQPPPPMPAYRPVEPPPRSAPIRAPAPAVPAEPEPSKIADSDRLPPPVLYQCNTYDHDSYLSENATPLPRCVSLQTTDLQGTSNSLGSACQMVTDQCQRVPDGAACTAWKQRLRETQAAWKFARPDDAGANHAEYERVLAIVRDSTCGK